VDMNSGKQGLGVRYTIGVFVNLR